jgi:hypothetical protein
MKKICLLLIGLVCLSVAVYAGEVITNDTGEDATGLRVSFSTPVLITAFGDILTSVDPQMLSFEFVFSGGTVKPWDSQWFNYAPATASVMEYEWLTGSVASDIPQGSLSRNDLLNLGRAPTYEEIMSVIAEYPGEDEPLYVPSDDEAIWLTDLEGHADIYDNDSIKINYAEWYDRSQITRIEVYRNGIKLRFLPDMLDVITNEQMKTFDGNSEEHSPASSHTDHAVFGYEYEFRLTGQAEIHPLNCVVRSGIRYEPTYLYAHLGHRWWWDIFRDPNVPSGMALQKLRDLKVAGFTGISFNVEYFVDSMNPTGIFAMHEPDPSVHPWSATTTLEEVRGILQLIDQAGLEADVRMEVWLSDEYKREYRGGHREFIEPANIPAFFTSYGNAAVELAKVAEATGAESFNPLTEMSSLARHVPEIHMLLDRIDAVFSGRLAIEEATFNMLNWPEGYGSSSRYADIASKFWDWQDSEGREIMIEMSCWTPPLNDNRDQRASNATEGFVAFWLEPVLYYDALYPERELLFGEIGTFNYDGQVLGLDWSYQRFPDRIRDDQELADIWAAYLIGSAALGIDGLLIWNFGLAPWDTPQADMTWLTGSWAERVIRAIAGIEEG